MNRTAKRNSGRFRGFEGDGWRSDGMAGPSPDLQPARSGEQPKAPVVICEGEKAADAAAAIFPQSIVTTSSGGAGAAAKTDWSPLAGRRVLIWPDNDEAGPKYAREVAAILAALDCEVSIIDAKALAALDPDGGRASRSKNGTRRTRRRNGPTSRALRKAAHSLAKPFDPGPAFVSYGSLRNDGQRT